MPPIILLDILSELIDIRMSMMSIMFENYSCELLILTIQFVVSRSRRRRSGPARRLGLTKLMDFTLGVMSQAAQPWRLVVGRVGRIGHGELKGMN